ncbi:MAG: DUF4199 domain-containing protein [Bacteroidales bacterium]|nr:DUF4199 domain-containing protein [Bacteroidales bacterium]
MSDKKTIWNDAALAGLVLGAIPMAYLYLSGVVGSFISILLWLVKFVGCIFLLRFFMLRFSNSNPDAGNSDVFKFGMLTAFLSALLYAAFNMAYMMFISPDTIKEAFDTIMENYSSMLDSNAREELEAMIPKIPTISFFGNLVYCWLFGTVLSAIFSREIPSSNPFDKNSSSDN